jgi:pentafunctional AROM polypeptide
MASTYGVAAQYGDIVKLVSKATTPSSNLALQAFAASHTAKPLVALNIGVPGQLSRVLNVCLTPVTHRLLPNEAAPGQLSVAEIHQAQHLCGLLPARQFYLFGTPIGHSMSPTPAVLAFACQCAFGWCRSCRRVVRGIVGSMSGSCSRWGRMRCSGEESEKPS